MKLGPDHLNKDTSVLRYVPYLHHTAQKSFVYSPSRTQASISKQECSEQGEDTVCPYKASVDSKIEPKIVTACKVDLGRRHGGI